MNPHSFAIVGAGWRTEFFLRIAAALPERFQLVGLVVRDAEKGRRLTEQWGYPTCRTVDELLASTSPEFLVSLDFGGNRQAIFDFVGVQYFSPIRNQRVAIRGERGEVIDEILYTQTDQGEPLRLPFQRHMAGPNGNLEGHYLKGIQLGEQWVNRNPTVPARLSDEEIAMADVLQGMGEYARGGPEICPLADALQDHYLGLLIRESAETGQTLIARAQPWADMHG